MGDFSTISAQYTTAKLTTYEPMVSPPTDNQEVDGVRESIVGAAVNTPVSEALLSAISTVITSNKGEEYVNQPIDYGMSVTSFTVQSTVAIANPMVAAPAAVVSNVTENMIKNVYGTSLDVSNAQRVLGITGYNYIRTDKSGFVMPASFNTNDIILGDTGVTGGIGNVNLNGAVRLSGKNRDEILKSIRNCAGIKNVYGAGIDLENAKNILGTTYFNYIKTDQPGFVKPASFSSNDIVVGGPGAEDGIGDIYLNGAIRLAGENRDLTAQAISNYNSPKNVYGAKIDLENAKKLLGDTGYNYLQTDESGFVMPASFNSNDIILGGTGTIEGIGNVNLNGATRLAGVNRDETYYAIKNYGVSKNVYGSIIDLSNAKRILGTTGYNYIQTNQPGFVMPTAFTSNDIILGGAGTSGGVGNVNLNGAARLAGIDRNDTIRLIKELDGPKNVYGAAVDLQNAKSILGTNGYNYIQSDKEGFVMPASFSSKDIVLGGILTPGGIGDVGLNGAARLAGTNRALTAQAINNYNSPKYVYGTGIDLENAKNILGYSGYNYIQTDQAGFVMPTSFNSNDIILGGAGTIGGIENVNLNGAVRLAGVNREETCNAIKNYAVSKNVYGPSVDLGNAKSILGTAGYNYIQTDILGFVMPTSFTCNDVILGGPGAIGGIGNVNLNGATRIAGIDRYDTIRLIKNYAGIPTEQDKLISGDSIASGSYGVVTGDNVNIRDGGSLNASILGQANKGEKLKVAYKEGDWYHVYWGDNGGWINAKYLSSNLGSVPSPDTSNSIPSGSYGVVTGDNVNIRSGGSISASILGQAGKGEKLKVAYRDGDWYHVYWGADGGWINANYLSPNLGSVSSPDIPDSIASGSWGEVTGNNVNIRRSGSINAEVLGQANSGEKLKVAHRQGEWYEVYWGASGGWIHANFLKPSSAPTSTTAKPIETGARYGTRVLYNGVEGNDVKNLQSDLVKLGYLDSTEDIDGKFGTKTEAEVKHFQEIHGLKPVDGKVGDDTKAQLEDSMKSYYSSHPWDKPDDYGVVEDTVDVDINSNEDWDLEEDYNYTNMSMLDYLGTVIDDIKNHPFDFAGGIAMGFDDSAFLGVPHKIAEWITGGHVDKDTAAYMAGKVLGDCAGFVHGLRTFLLGLTEEVAGFTFDATGIGAILGGLELNAAGVATMAYAGTVVVNSGQNTINDMNMLFAKAKSLSGSARAVRRPSIKNPKLIQRIVNEDNTVTYVMKTASGREVRVTYNQDGFPDFSPYKYKGTDGLSEVKVKCTGDRYTDFKLANEKAGFVQKPEGYTWHHLPDGETMILVETEVHETFAHTGGFALR